MRLDEVYARYARRADWVLRGVDAEVKDGEVVVVTGRNGAGKSTLLRVLAGMIPVGRGQLRDRPAVVSWLPDRFPTAQPFTVRTYLRAMGRIRGLDQATTDAAADELADRLHLTPFMSTRLAELSQGSGRKVGLVLALLSRPGLLVMDEPWEGLDAQSQAELPALVEEVTTQGGICVLTDHRGRSGDLGTIRHWSVRDGLVVEEDAPTPTPRSRHVIEVVVHAHDPATEVARLRAAGYDVRRVRGEA